MSSSLVMAKPDTKRVWRIEVYIRATDAEAEEVVERLGAAICPDPFHFDYCPVPWSILRFRPKGKAAKYWKKYFREERAAAKDAGDLPREVHRPPPSVLDVS